jgi:hypothetical protein
MPRRLPSSALDQQTQITASGTGAVLAGTWYIGTAGGGSGGAVAGTLNGPLTGTADSAKVLTPGKALNGQTFTGGADITVPVNTTSITTSGTYYPTFVPSNTAGNQQASTNTSLSYDPNTGYLSATRFVGSGAGLTDVVTSISFNGAAAQGGAVSITSPAQVQPDWDAVSGLGSILNKPALFSGSYTDLTNKPALFSGSYTDLTNKPSIPTALSSLSQDTVMYGNAGVSYGMGGYGGVGYTLASGAVDDASNVFTVPSTGRWSFNDLTILFRGTKDNQNGWVDTTCYVIGSLEIAPDANNVFYSIAWRAWDFTGVTQLTNDGRIRYTGSESNYHAGGEGLLQNINSPANSEPFNKSYYLFAGSFVRFRVLWATTLPVKNQTGGSTGVTGGTLRSWFNLPSANNYNWRSYPIPMYGGVDGSWYAGANVIFSATRVST